MSVFSERAQRFFNETYINIDNKYNFNLPVLEISLTLPAQSGFNVDMADELRHCVNIEDKDVYYFFDTDVLEDTNVEVRFSLPKTDEAALFMGMMLLPENVGLGTLSQSYIDAGTYLSSLPDLQSGIGKFRGFKIQQDDKHVNIYLLRHNGIFYFFQYNSDNEDFGKNIIQSVQKKDYDSSVFEVYEEHLDYLNEHNGEEEEIPELKEFEGKLSLATVFTIADLGFTVTIPQNYSYACPANGIEDKNNGAGKEIVLSKGDLKNQGIVSLRFNSNKGLFFICVLWGKGVLNVEERISADVKMQQKLKSFQLIVDDIPFEAVALGHNENPTINAYAQLNDYGVSLSFLNIEKDRLGEVEALIDNITFDKEQKVGIQQDKKKKSILQILKTNIFSQKDKSIADVVKIKDKEVKALSELVFTKSANFNEDVVFYDFIYLGVSCKLPPMDIFANPEGSLEDISENEKQITADLSNTHFASVSVNEFGEDYSHSFSVTIVKSGEYSDLDVLMDATIKQWASFNHIKVEKSGIGLIDGRRWGMIQTKQVDMYMTMFITLYKDMNITFMENSMDSSLQKSIDLLHTFRFEE